MDTQEKRGRPGTDPNVVAAIKDRFAAGELAKDVVAAGNAGVSPAKVYQIYREWLITRKAEGAA